MHISALNVHACSRGLSSKLKHASELASYDGTDEARIVKYSQVILYIRSKINLYQRNNN